jgi:hypothetical protein
VRNTNSTSDVFVTNIGCIGNMGGCEQAMKVNKKAIKVLIVLAMVLSRYAQT